MPVVGLAGGLLILDGPVTGWQWAGIALAVLALGCVMFGDTVARRWHGR